MLELTSMLSPGGFPGPFRLIPDFKERIWGVSDLGNLFPDVPAGSIGEAWFTAPHNRTSVGPSLGDLLRDQPQLLGSGCNPLFWGLCPLLVKLLFTRSRLSVQVHPNDDYAQRHHGSLED